MSSWADSNKFGTLTRQYPIVGLSQNPIVEQWWGLEMAAL
jgi:hypothetical protein